MHIWMINHYAGLPATVPATRPYDVARHLVCSGHRVTIFACSFNHYTFAEEQLSGARLFKVGMSDGVRIVWIRGTPYRGNGLARLFNMLTFSLLAVLAGMWRFERPDLVIGTTVHPFAPLAAYVISRVRRARFWLDITDIWPQSLIDLGHIEPTSVPARVFAACELFSLRRAERVMSVLPNIDDYLRDKGVSKPTLWTPNGYDAGRIPPRSADLRASDERGFTVMYAGGFAPAHALDVVVEAAKILQARDANHVRFSLIGDGPEMPRIRQLISKYRLTSVSLPGFLPKQELYPMLAGADALVVTGRSLPVYRYGIAYNKIPDYMLIGRPIIFALDAANNAVAEAGAGLSVPGENPTALADAIVELSRMTTEERRQMGERGRTFAEQSFDYASTARRVAATLAEA